MEKTTAENLLVLHTVGVLKITNVWYVGIIIMPILAFMVVFFTRGYMTMIESYGQKLMRIKLRARKVYNKSKSESSLQRFRRLRELCIKLELQK